MPEQRKGRCVDCGEQHQLGTHCPMYHECCGRSVSAPHSDTCENVGECICRDRSSGMLNSRCPEHGIKAAQAILRIPKPDDACICPLKGGVANAACPEHGIDALECTARTTAAQEQADESSDHIVSQMVRPDPAIRRCCGTRPDQEHLPNCLVFPTSNFPTATGYVEPRAQCLGCGDVVHPGRACLRGPTPGHNVSLMAPSVRLTAVLEDMRRLWHSTHPSTHPEVMAMQLSQFMASTVAALDTMRELMDARQVMTDQRMASAAVRGQTLPPEAEGRCMRFADAKSKICQCAGGFCEIALGDEPEWKDMDL